MAFQRHGGAAPHGRPGQGGPEHRRGRHRGRRALRRGGVADGRCDGAGLHGGDVRGGGAADRLLPAEQRRGGGPGPGLPDHRGLRHVLFLRKPGAGGPYQRHRQQPHPLLRHGGGPGGQHRAGPGAHLRRGPLPPVGRWGRGGGHRHRPGHRVRPAGPLRGPGRDPLRPRPSEAARRPQRAGGHLQGQRPRHRHEHHLPPHRHGHRPAGGRLGRRGGGSAEGAARSSPSAG